MRNRLLALAAAALLSGTAAVSAQGLSQDQSQSPKSQTKDQIARPDAAVIHVQPFHPLQPASVAQRGQVRDTALVDG